MSNVVAPIEVFCSYAHQDESHLQELKTHLSGLQRQGRISTWYNRQINAGTSKAEAIDTHLETASLVLLLVSADFLTSNYCFEVEMRQAMQRHETSVALVLPIIVRPCDWTHTPFAKLQCLPRNGQPVTKWADRDDAWNDVVAGIRRALDDLPLLVASAPRTAIVTLSSTSQSLWNIPYPSNPFFTGQDALLTRLADTLKTGQPQAISGLGGVGKTQIAVEYAYRHRQDYRAIFWVRADTQEALISGYVVLAQTLNLREQKEQDQTVIVQAVLRWLSTHPGWLLILDNVDNLVVLEGLLPSELLGHLLLTTRLQALGTRAHPLEVTTMPQGIGATLLLRRARLIPMDASLEAALPADATLACAISEELGGLPLALDQAGAYIEETRCGLARYQHLYLRQPSPFLKRRGSSKYDYPASVATTWSLSFKNVEQQNQVAAELLRCCAFVHPDTIPEELFVAGVVVHLGPVLRQVELDPMAFDNAVGMLLAYSLIHRDSATATLSIHRLVQAVLIDAMPTKTRKLWRKRVIQAVNEAFPAVTFEEWTRCGRLLPHVQICTAWIEQEPIPVLAAAHVFHKAGTYLRERGQYANAEPLLVQALAIYEQHLGTEHLEAAPTLNNLALLYERQGKYEQAKSLYQRAIAIREQHLGTEHPDTANSLNDLAIIYWQLSKYEEAESLFQQALAIREQHLGAAHPDTARTLNGLANLYLWLGKYKEAEPLYQRALAIRERCLGAEHPDTAKSLNNLAILYRDQGKYEQAESLFWRAIAIREQHLGAEHPDLAGSLEDLAILYQRRGEYEQAELLCQRALIIREQCLGSEHPNTARNMNNLAELYRLQNKYALAEPLHRRALAIWEQHLGAEHPDTAEALHGLAELYREQGKYEQAEVFYQRAIAIREQRLGLTHLETQHTRKGYAALLCAIGRDVEATALDIGDKPISSG